MSAFDKASLAALKQFVQLIAANPAVLHTPELSFFKSYLESLGAKIPKAPAAADEGHGHAHGGHGHAHGGHGHAHGGDDDHGHSHGGEGGGHGHSHGGKACHGHGGDEESKAEGHAMDDEDDDEPLEFKFDEPEPTMEAADDKFDDGLETVTPDVVDDTVSTVPDMSVEPSDEAIEKASAEKQAALAALESGDHASAIAHYTTAISLNPASSLLVAGRAAVFLAQKKPNAAIKDANIALQANPDSAKALKIRGKAYTLLGDYENAHKDLSRGLQVDYDDETQQLAKKVQARVDTVHRRVRKHELAKEEWMKRKVMAQRAWLKKKQEWEERRRQREEAMNDDNPYAGAGGQPNMADFAKMFGGAGGAGGQPNMADFAKMFGGGAGGAGGKPNMAEFAKMFGGAGGAGGPDFSSMFGGAGRGAGAGAGAGPKPAQAAEEVD